jgi:hypothetical protein
MPAGPSKALDAPPLPLGVFHHQHTPVGVDPGPLHHKAHAKRATLYKY